jgi:adenylylsulfate kinase-like enzyme
VGTGVTVWFTGLPSAGKTTIASLVEKRLAAAPRQVEVLDLVAVVSAGERAALAARPQLRW